MSTLIRHIAVVSINRDKYSETFIHDSFDYFPVRKSLLYGGYLPTHVTADWRKEGSAIPIARPPFWKRIPKNEEARRAYSLTKWLQKNRPDVVLAHYGPSGVMMAPICKALRIPLVVHFHGYDAYRSDILNSYGLQYPTMFSTATTIVSSFAMQRQLAQAFEEKVFHAVCTYGVKLSQFPPQPIPEGPFTYLFVGRFVPKKAPDQLLKAFAKVHEKLPEVRLGMAGDGELLETCRQLALDLGLGESVSFLGVLSPAEVTEKLNASSALVLPSRRTEDGDSEGTPLVILEAGAAMRPVIATRHGGIRDIIRDEENGILVPENDIEALADAMHFLAKNPLKARKLGFAALKNIQENHTQAQYHQNLWQFLENAIRYHRNS